MSNTFHNYISKSRRAPAISKKLIELEEPFDKPIAKTAPKQSESVEVAYTVSNVAYSKMKHTQPILCSGYSVVGPTKEVCTYILNACKIICSWVYA